MLNDGAQSLQEIQRHGLESGVARIQNSRETSPLRHEFDVVINPFRERLASVERSSELNAGVRTNIDFAAQRSDNKIRTFRKVAINRANPNAGPLGNLAYRRVHA